MLDYAALAALAAVVREGSFERAAQRLHVTPSAVSQRVRALEERVGAALVVRAQPCRATALGQRLCQHVDRVALLEQELHDPDGGGAPSDAAGAPPAWPTLAIAVNADSLATWLAPALTAFAAQAQVLLDIAVDNEDQTADWLRRGAVLAAVTAVARAPAGCSSRALGRLRYVAAASPAFVARWFAHGVGAASLARAPSLRFNAHDDLQDRWAQRLCRRVVPLPCHRWPSPQGFVDAARAGMGWGMHPRALVEPLLHSGALVELCPGAALDVPLYWQQARAARLGVLDALTHAVQAAARDALSPAGGTTP